MRHHATRKIGFALLTIVLALGATATMRAQEKVTGDKLGTVHFPVSCTAAAQAELDRAVALLHSFWWGPATDSFRGVLAHDPTCGMAHWGIAMAALGMINVLYGLLPALAANPAEPSWRITVASLGFLIGGISMPAVCFLSAWRPGFRHLFFVPVTALIVAVVQTLRNGP